MQLGRNAMQWKICLGIFYGYLKSCALYRLISEKIHHLEETTQTRPILGFDNLGKRAAFILRIDHPRMHPPNHGIQQ
jgi:hypothetical protein